MKLLFLGTRGGIQVHSSLHTMHSVLMIIHEQTTIIIDWGQDWLRHSQPPADALLITHSHDDHVGGLAYGTSWPVYASLDTWTSIYRYPIKDRIIIHPRVPFLIGSLSIEPFTINHSLKAPALGYRISSDTHSLFYISDVASIKDEKKALSNLDLYIGDGALITRTMLLRKKNGSVTGHAPIAHQLAWCQKYSVPQAIFTHCGTETVTGDPISVQAKITTLAQHYRVPTSIAFDGMALLIH